MEAINIYPCHCGHRLEDEAFLSGLDLSLMIMCIIIVYDGDLRGIFGVAGASLRRKRGVGVLGIGLSRAGLRGIGLSRIGLNRIGLQWIGL